MGLVDTRKERDVWRIMMWKGPLDPVFVIQVEWVKDYVCIVDKKDQNVALEGRKQASK